MSGPVICGVEDSATSTGAVDVARKLARGFGVPLLFVHVVGDRVDANVSDGVVLLRSAVDASRGIGAAAMVETGHPADRLVALAQEREASFVVVGCHGPRSSILGSISADVSRRAPCPVVVVPTDAPTRNRSAAAALVERAGRVEARSA